MTQAQELGDVIKKARLAKGLSLRDVERESGVHFSMIGYIENGKRLRPRPDVLKRIAKVIDVPFAQLHALIGSSQGLPELPVYLRAKYGLSPDAASELDQHFRRIRERDRKNKGGAS